MKRTRVTKTKAKPQPKKKLCSKYYIDKIKEIIISADKKTKK